MNIIRFNAGDSKQQNELYSITIQACSFKAQITDSCFEMFNRKAFTIFFDQNGVVQNPNDHVQVSVNDIKARKIRFDWIRVQAVAYNPRVQSYIQSVLKQAQWDQAEGNADKINQQLAPHLQQLETEMLLDKIYEMNRQQAIDAALDNQDEQAFMQLVRGEVAVK